MSLCAVTLYNCSVGRGDCSLCKNADQKYGCVWCPKHKACVYKDLCISDQPGADDPYNTECPDPQITDVSGCYCHLFVLNYELERCIKGW